MLRRCGFLFEGNRWIREQGDGISGAAVGGCLTMATIVYALGLYLDRIICVVCCVFL